MYFKLGLLAAFVACLLGPTVTTTAEETNALTASPVDLKKLSIEELMNIEVTSVTRREQPVTQAAAAIHVVTNEDIRRSGARSLPEALRLLPNLQAAQANAREWTITARGFNGGAANKMLVMIDGRTVYTPLFSGVFWDAQDTLLEDIDRIEAISGPGATLWGANAVNGVINVITRSAKQTQGTLISGGGGSEERGFGSIRYGGKMTEDLHYRVYGKYFDRDSSALPDGRDGGDAWAMGQGGFRLDWDVREDNLLTIQGDLYGARGDQLMNSDLSFAGGNLLTRWSRTLSDDTKVQLQAYYDRTYRDIPGTFAEHLDTYDLDSQFETRIGERNYVTSGLGYRFTHNSVKNSPGLAFYPEELDRHLFSAFLQDEVTLLPDALHLTIGSKIEHNEYTGVEIQPSIRLAWTNDRHVVWGAISRAVRTPSRFDRHLYIPANAPFVLAGGPNFASEKVIAYELGYRVKPQERVFVSISTFYNDYEDIRSISAPPFAMIENNLEGETYGAEIELTFHATDWWRITAGYMVFEESIGVEPGEFDFNSGRAENPDPEQRFILRSSFDLPRGFELDFFLRYVDTLHTISNGTFGSVPSYVELDARLGWQITRDVEISIVGQNLFDKQHPEFGHPTPLRHEIERGVYGKITWQF